MLEKAPKVMNLWADGGHQGPKLASKLEEPGLGGLPETAEKTEDIEGFTVPYGHCLVERTIDWLSRCRRLVQDCERSPESSLAWVRLTA